MKRLIVLFGIAAVLCAQDEGGRDGGADTAIVFVRSRRTDESNRIWHAAWRALEPHNVQRERLADFDGSAEKARAFFEKHARAALVVTFDYPAVQLVPKGLTVLRVGDADGDHIVTRTDRDQFARILRLFKPGAGSIAVFGGMRPRLPGFHVALEPKMLRQYSLAWIQEGAPVDAAALRKELDSLKIPLVSTAPELAAGTAALTVRPDPDSMGLNLAALVLRHVRGKRKLPTVRVRRSLVTVDLAAARAAGHEVPLALLARADAIRRKP